MRRDRSRAIQPGWSRGRLDGTRVVKTSTHHGGVNPAAALRGYPHGLPGLGRRRGVRLPSRPLPHHDTEEVGIMLFTVYSSRSGRLVAQTGDPITAADYQAQGYIVEQAA